MPWQPVDPTAPKPAPSKPHAGRYVPHAGRYVHVGNDLADDSIRYMLDTYVDESGNVLGRSLSVSLDGDSWMPAADLAPAPGTDAAGLVLAALSETPC